LQVADYLPAGMPARQDGVVLLIAELAQLTNEDWH
jgi:hypothetical protein